jgi:hypothetical protein
MPISLTHLPCDSKCRCIIRADFEDITIEI